MKFNYLLVSLLSLLLAVTIFFGFNFSKIKQPIFVLLTDFGNDFAVASMKAVITNKSPNAKIIDLDHTIDKFNIISAGFVLQKTYQYFPKGSTFICIIDPGVGTQREPLCIKTADYTFVGPNNGIFDFVLEQEKNCMIYQINEAYYLQQGHNTFHGRDLFSPAAVDFYEGNLNPFQFFDKNKLVHKIVSDQIVATFIDSYGNIKTNLSSDLIDKKEVLTIKIKEKEYKIPFVKTFANVPYGTLLCYAGSNGTLEIAVNQGSAKDELQLKVGEPITVEK